MVLPDSRRITRVLRYSGVLLERPCFRLRGYHPLWLSVQCRSASSVLCNSMRGMPTSLQNPTTPLQQRQHACTEEVSAVPCPLATTRGVSFDFLSFRYLDVSVP